MYINCIKFIMEVKKGVPFTESSPVLTNISGAASWQKVTQVDIGLNAGYGQDVQG